MFFEEETLKKHWSSQACGKDTLTIDLSFGLKDCYNLNTFWCIETIYTYRSNSVSKSKKKYNYFSYTYLLQRSCQPWIHCPRTDTISTIFGIFKQYTTTDPIHSRNLILLHLLQESCHPDTQSIENPNTQTDTFTLIIISQ